MSRALRVGLFFVVVFGVLAWFLRGQIPAPITRCESSGSLRVICGLQHPETLLVVPDDDDKPGTRFVLASEYGGFASEAPGAIALYDATTQRVKSLFPQSGIATEPIIEEGPDWGDKACPGPPDKRFDPLGIDLYRRADHKLQVLAANHGGREAVEIFELLRDGDNYRLAWRGCVPATSSDMFFNSVAALPDGGFAVTHMFPKSYGSAQQYQLARAVFGVDTGYVLRWKPGTPLHKLPGSGGPFLNGLVASRDGKTLFVNSYMGNQLRVLDAVSGNTLASAAVAHPDNVSWSDDGRLLVASHSAGLLAYSPCAELKSGACGAGFEIIAIDPKSLAETKLFAHAGAPMGAATSAVPFGKDLLLGSYASDRMLRVPR